MANFVEMRDSVADDRFLLRKKIEAALHKRFPDRWLPLYSMVTFSNMRYSDAQERGKLQNRVMDEVMAQPQIAQNWQSLDLEALVKQLPPLPKV